LLVFVKLKNTMKKFTFKVTVTDVYQKQLTFEAENLNDAIRQLDEDLDACPIETQSNTLESSSTDKELKLKGKDNYIPVELVEGAEEWHESYEG
jgi:hypothetical protein